MAVAENNGSHIDKKTMQFAASVITGAELDITQVAPLIGKGPRERAEEAFEYLKNTNMSLLFIGDSGSGKSAAMQAVLKKYGAHLTRERRMLKHGEPYHVCSVAMGCTTNDLQKVYYFQLSADETKTTLFVGNRMIAGTYALVEGIMAIAARQGAPIGVDEIGHGTPSLITMFNSFDGASSRITNGDVSIDATHSRVIYGTNRSTHDGNIQLPQSFVNRVLGIDFEYPDFDDEVLIAHDLAKRTYLAGDITVPVAVMKYITTFVREFRTATFPLSARNISRGIVMCQMAPIVNKNVNVSLNRVDRHFKISTNAEPLQRMITRRITGVEATGTSSLQSPEILQFIEFVSRIGIDKFKQILLRTVNYSVDTAGLEFDDTTKQKIVQSLI